MGPPLGTADTPASRVWLNRGEVLSAERRGEKRVAVLNSATGEELFHSNSGDTAMIKTLFTSVRILDCTGAEPYGFFVTPHLATKKAGMTPGSVVS